MCLRDIFPLSLRIPVFEEPTETALDFAVLYARPWFHCVRRFLTTTKAPVSCHDMSELCLGHWCFGVLLCSSDVKTFAYYTSRFAPLLREKILRPSNSLPFATDISCLLRNFHRSFASLHFEHPRNCRVLFLNLGFFYPFFFFFYIIGCRVK